MMMKSSPMSDEQNSTCCAWFLACPASNQLLFHIPNHAALAARMQRMHTVPKAAGIFCRPCTAGVLFSRLLYKEFRKKLKMHIRWKAEDSYILQLQLYQQSTCCKAHTHSNNSTTAQNDNMKKERGKKKECYHTYSDIVTEARANISQASSQRTLQKLTGGKWTACFTGREQGTMCNSS